MHASGSGAPVLGGGDELDGIGIGSLDGLGADDDGGIDVLEVAGAEDEPLGDVDTGAGGVDVGAGDGEGDGVGAGVVASSTIETSSTSKHAAPLSTARSVSIARWSELPGAVTR